MPEAEIYQFSGIGDLAKFRTNIDYLQLAVDLAHQWLSGTEFFKFQTSGSTGKPKEILLSRSALVWSAKNSITALDLNKNQSALLCLPADKVGGAMMIIRAAITEQPLSIVKPSLNPSADIREGHSFKVVSLLSAQLKSFLANDISTQKLNAFEIVIVGGSPLDFNLEKTTLEKAPNCRFYHSYGMTETASHIALRPFSNQKKRIYKPLPGVKVGLSAGGCLKIKCPATENRWFTTSDLAKIESNGAFEILGRSDFAIISGGIKIIPEMIEEKISESGILSGQNFILAAVPDERLGQKAILVLEGTNFQDEKCLAELKQILPKYHNPRQIAVIEKFPLNAGNKPDRFAIADTAARILNQQNGQE